MAQALRIAIIVERKCLNAAIEGSIEVILRLAPCADDVEIGNLGSAGQLGKMCARDSDL